MRYLKLILFLFVSQFVYGQGIEPFQIQGSTFNKGFLRAVNKVWDENVADSVYQYIHVDSTFLNRYDSIYNIGSVIYLKNGSGSVTMIGGGGPDSTELFSGYGITISEITANNYVIKSDTAKMTTVYANSLKQNTLVSGTNIKTVNSTSLLGSGNLAVGTVTSVTSANADATVATTTTTPVITIVSAPKLTTARTIAGVSFDGTANISLNNNAITNGAGYTTNTGTVTSVSVVNANGVSGTVATATTTPAITLTLGAITPSTIVATSTISGTNLSGTNTGDNATNTQYSGLVSNATHTGEVTGATVLTIASGAVTLAKMANMATSSLIYRRTAGTGVPEVNTMAQLKTDLAIVENATHTGEVTGATVLTIANNAVTNAKAAQMSANTIKGNNTGILANSLDLTAAQVRTMLNVADGATANVGTVTGVTASSPLASSGGTAPNITIQNATTGQTGALTSTDWNTFNNKGSGTITGSGTANQITYFTGATAIASLSTVTYPSLTELSYVKGATSAIQNQLNLVLNTWRTPFGSDILNFGALGTFGSGSSVCISCTSASRKFDVYADVRFQGAIYNSSNSAGSSGQVLTSQGAGAWTWTTPSGGVSSVTASSPLSSSGGSNPNITLNVGAGLEVSSGLLQFSTTRPAHMHNTGTYAQDYTAATGVITTMGNSSHSTPGITAASNRFTMNAQSVGRDFEIIYTVTIAIGTGTAETYSAYIKLNGTKIAQSQTEFRTQNNGTSTLTKAFVVSPSSSTDYYELFTECTGTITGNTIKYPTMTIKQFRVN